MVTSTDHINAIDVPALAATVAAVQEDPAKARVAFKVGTIWEGQTRSRSVVESYELAGQSIPRSFEIIADEPVELLGQNSAPNPQELLMSAINACMIVGYAANASLRGIALTKLEIEMRGELDLRGFLGLDDSVKPGYHEVDYVVRISGDGTPEQFEEIHRAVQKTSPNFFNLNSAVGMNPTLEVI